MSDFVRQNAAEVTFNSSDSWVILSPIELSIKNKIEKVGVPLKDWDINIYRGVLTGYNEAFIISTEKRDEILSKCQTPEERQRTEELIRPILRGRDIKRYGYEWADLWLIATFPSRHYDIDLYPAVKDYLLSFGMERLEQTGKEYIVNGEKIKARKRTNNKWFETQDSISYWDDFCSPKIIWAELSRTGNSFVLDEEQHFLGNTGYILTDSANDKSKLLYLLANLNSRIILYQLDRITTRFDNNGWRWLRQFIEQIRIPRYGVSSSISSIAASTTRDNQLKNSEIINKEIYRLFGLSKMEIEYINCCLRGY